MYLKQNSFPQTSKYLNLRPQGETITTCPENKQKYVRSGRGYNKSEFLYFCFSPEDKTKGEKSNAPSNEK